MNQPILTAAALARGVNELTGRDPVLSWIVGEFGAPPLWARRSGFPALLRIILEQQVSLASGKAAFDRLVAAASPLTPESFLLMDDAALKQIGFSRQKTRYGRHLALAIHSGTLDLNRLQKLEDASVREELMKVRDRGLDRRHLPAAGAAAAGRLAVGRLGARGCHSAFFGSRDRPFRGATG